MRVRFRMNSGQTIRDGSGRYGCPNLFCWGEYSTALKPPANANIYDESRYTKCPNCNIELDWGFIIEDYK